MKKLLFALLICVVFPAVSMAAGSCTFRLDGDPYTEYELTWVCTAHTDGSISSPTVTGHGKDAAYSGRIDRVKIISGAGLSAGALRLYSGTDTTDDLLGSLGAIVNTAEGTTLTDAPLTTSNGFVRKIREETLTPAGSGLGNGGVITLKVLLVRPKP